MNYKEFYLSPKGRLNRKDFVLKFYGPWLVLMLVLLFLFLFQESDGLHEIFLFATAWPYCVTLIKRFHDFGQSAWIAILGYPLFLSLAGGVVGWLLVQNISIFIPEDVDPVGIATVLPLLGAFVVIFAILLVPAFIPGNKGENKYGAAT